MRQYWLTRLLVLVVVDSVTNIPVSWPQKLAWIPVVFSTGPIGLFMHFLNWRRWKEWKTDTSNPGLRGTLLPLLLIVIVAGAAGVPTADADGKWQFVNVSTINTPN